jgi:tetratricopeptide (TPR) repeat protein
MWQANYFKTTANPPMAYYLSAGESYLIFNEFVQLFESVGLVGFLFFSLLLYWFFRSGSLQHMELIHAAKATMAVILVTGLTSYPFHVNAILLLTTFCLAAAAIAGDKKLEILSLQAGCEAIRLFAERWAQVSLCAMLIITAGLTAFRSAKQYFVVREWQYVRDRSPADREGVKKKYRELYRSLNGDGKFLTDYGDYLSAIPEDCSRAVEVLEEAKSLFISRKTVELTGYAYKQIDNYPKAIENFEWISDYLPSNFSSKLELLKLYTLSGDSARARSMGTRILTMPVKIPSEEVDRIKRETREILKQFD